MGKRVAAAVAFVIGAAGAGGTAFADDDAASKPSLAVVIDGKDDATAKLADALAAALRRRLGRADGSYRAVGTAKEIARLELAAECSAIEPACAAKLGAALGVDYMLTGELEAKGAHRVLVLGLVKVDGAVRLRSLRDSVAASVAVKRWARVVLARLFERATGELVVIANAARGEVLLDGQIVAALYAGRTTISGLPLGPHQLAIVARGYKRFEVDVDIDGSNQETVLLEPDAP